MSTPSPCGAQGSQGLLPQASLEEFTLSKKGWKEQRLPAQRGTKHQVSCPWDQQGPSPMRHNQQKSPAGLGTNPALGTEHCQQQALSLLGGWQRVDPLLDWNRILAPGNGQDK